MMRAKRFFGRDQAGTGLVVQANGEETNYLRVHLAHLRRKLEPVPSQPRYFHTEPGMPAVRRATNVADVPRSLNPRLRH